MTPLISPTAILAGFLLRKAETRALAADGEGMAPAPFAYDPDFFERLRPDQVPRFLGMLTDRISLPTKTFPMEGLIAIQDRVKVEKVDAMRGGKRKGHPVVAIVDGAHFIVDGHHGAAAAYLDGEAELTAHYKDLTEVTSAVKSSVGARYTENPIDGLVIEMPAIIKAVQMDDGRRMVEVEASVEMVDSEGDLILQQALMDSAESFVSTGHLDIDHISELGKKYGIKNPESYIVGRPTAVKDIGEKRTSVVGEIMRSMDGLHDPIRNRFDAFWDTFKSEPPVHWRASVYGYPKTGQVIDCSEQACEGGAWRYIIKGLDWRSFAFTRNPVNTNIKSHAQIVTAKAFVLSKSLPFGDDLSVSDYYGATDKPAGALMAPPRNLSDALGQYYGHMAPSCPHVAGTNSTVLFRNHFEYCCGMERDAAEVFGHALMHHLLLHRRRTAA